MPLTLQRTLELLESLAPLSFAESWDNVGLLVEPELPSEGRPISRVLFTIDLTKAVLDEAERLAVELVVAYHPVIFKGLMRVRASQASETVVAGALARGIAVYSPHTACDAAPAGVNDWLAQAVGPGVVTPLVSAQRCTPGDEYKLVVFVPAESADTLRHALARAGAGVIGAYSDCSFNLQGTGTFFGHEGTDPAVGTAGKLERVDELRLEMVCHGRSLPGVARAIEEAHPYEEPAWDLYPLAPKPALGFGMGRAVELSEPAPLGELAARVKRHLGLDWLRVAACKRHAEGAAIRRVAVCAGAGRSLFERAAGFDLYLSGELGHHDVLAKNADGASVILCEHGNSERGFLPHFAARLARASEGALETLVAETDREPLAIT
ncbi:MAG TPA: Nif3-like dinuclear metal center hexameric protein [Polyangiaceae bacterium]|nr:Nif3-like dinuclear metal center hexameric protein [Polyangiaceae bacterium]